MILVACGHPHAAGRPSRSSPTSEITPSPGRLPPLPAESGANEPGQPPIVWVGGKLTEASENRVVIQEAPGSTVAIRRLGKEATAFYQPSGGRWIRLAPQAGIVTGGDACVEVALDGTNLLALRVFLGATCGPAR